MLLKALSDLAHSPGRHILDDLAFSAKTVRWIIDLDKDGTLLGVGLVQTGDGRRGKEFLCPQTTRNKLAGGVAEFLADGISAVFGLDADPDAEMSIKKRIALNENIAHKKADFFRQIEEAGSEIDSEDLRAVTIWARGNLKQPTFLEWQPATGDAKKGVWLVRQASGEQARMGPDNFTFRIAGRLLLDEEAIRVWWRTRHSKERIAAQNVAARGICLVSGCPDQPIPSTHFKITGVPNTPAFGGSIVSFDKDAFASYGFDQNLNAPISDSVATAYRAALNWLLNQKDHHLKLGDSVLCFWARDDENHTDLFASLLNNPQPDAVRIFVVSPWSGIARDLAKRDRFFAVTLCGNAGRIAVRHWMQCPLDAAIDNLHAWFRDLEIEVPPPLPSKYKPKGAAGKMLPPPLGIYRLACTTVREEKGLRTAIPSQLYRAALEGTAPSLSLVKPVLDQLHSLLVRDERYNLLYDESRFALLKLILNRNRKESDMEIQPKLTSDTPDPAYNCGRLLAVFDDLQRRSHGWKLTGSSVAERYYASASATPATAFGILWRLHIHHLKKLGSLGGKDAAAATAIERKISEIAVLFGQTPELIAQHAPPEFPRTLNLHAQGRFALGFYQQKAEEQAGIAAHTARNPNKAADQTIEKAKQ